MASLLDVRTFPYEQRLTAAALQGLLNRQGPLLFLDYGPYDDVSARTTNEEFISDELWHSTFRQALGEQDLENARFYRRRFGLEFMPAASLDDLIREHRSVIQGAVVWDPASPDTVNIALMLAAREDLLVISPAQIAWAQAHEVGITHDLRGRWPDRISLYRWALKNLLPGCLPGALACVEPGWQRPEFVDYLVQNRVFTYSLSTKSSSRIFKLGQAFLLMLVGGPAWLRNLLFDLRLDGLVRWKGLLLMGLGSAETRLASRIQHEAAGNAGGGAYPTIYGWHTRRDDEFSFMLHLSANGLRLVPSHLAANFSFHSRVPCPQLTLPAADPPNMEQPPQPGLVYLTFTLSDGDQLMMMNTAELGNWRRPERGQVPFNWEVQPLLAEIAPALLEQYTSGLAPGDCLVAGPSGAGYVIPPLVPNLKRYLDETARVCSQAGIRVLTSYIADPPRRVIAAHSPHAGRMGRIPGRVWSPGGGACSAGWEADLCRQCLAARQPDWTLQR